MRLFSFLIQLIYWLWLFLVPVLALGSMGLLLYVRKAENLPYLVILSLVGVVLGVIWAEKVRRRTRPSEYFSRIIATPDIDNVVGKEKDAGPDGSRFKPELPADGR